MRIISRLCLTVSLMLGANLAILGQQQRGLTGRVSLVPAYPPDGNIPPQYSNQFVFADTKTGDLVLSFPENLGMPDFAQNPGRRITVKLELGTHVLPAISVRTWKDDPGKYVYEYNLENRPGARQAIMNCYLPLPSPESVRDIQQPSGWGNSSFNLGLASSNIGEMSGIGWFSRGEAHAVRPGSQLHAFRVTSVNRPGFVTVYVRGNAHVLAVPGELPDEVSKQLLPLRRLENDSQPLLTIGPRFRPDTNKIVIAGEFFAGISRLIGHHQLDAEAAFVKEALSVLKTYLEAAQQQGNTPAEQFIGPPLQFSQKPSPGLETEIYEALKLSLDISQQ